MIRNRDFAATLNRLLERYGISVYRLAEDAGLDRPNLWRMTRGKNSEPTRQSVMLISYGLARHGALPVELDELMISAGYAPAFLRWKPETEPAPSNGQSPGA